MSESTKSSPNECVSCCLWRHIVWRIACSILQWMLELFTRQQKKKKKKLFTVLTLSHLSHHQRVCCSSALVTKKSVAVQNQMNCRHFRRYPFCNISASPAAWIFCFLLVTEHSTAYCTKLNACSLPLPCFRLGLEPTDRQTHILYAHTHALPCTSTRSCRDTGPQHSAPAWTPTHIWMTR